MILTAKYINNGEERSVTFKSLELLNSFFDFTNPCTEFGINLCGCLRLNSNRFNGIVYITKYRAKTFLWKSTDGRGEPSSTHTEEQIKQNWSLTDEDEDGQTLEEFLELSENGDKWIKGTEILENIS